MKEEYLEPFVGTDGRLKVNLVDKDGISHIEDLARIVAVTFPDIVGKPKSGLPLFKDGNVENCAADNLYWE